jgi:hypothetical protein
MGDIGKAAREIIHDRARALHSEFKTTPWFARRRRAEIIGALNAIVQIHGDVCDMLMDENERRYAQQNTED